MLESPLPLRDYCLSCIREAVVEVRDKVSIGNSSGCSYGSDAATGIDPAPNGSAMHHSPVSSSLDESLNERHNAKLQSPGAGHHRQHHSNSPQQQQQQPQQQPQPVRPDRSCSQPSPAACPASRSSSSGSIFDDITASPDDDLMSASVSRFLSRSNVLSSSHLIANISEPLLTSLSEEGRINDNILMTIFHPDNCRLESVIIPDASQLTKKGLRVLRGHKIRRLEVISLQKATINELIGCLGEYTLHNVSHFSVSRSFFTSSSRFCVVVGLAKLRNLKHLDVSHTDINHHGLEIIVEDLPNLISLNISSTRVRDLQPLRKCRSRLRSLSMYNLRPAPAADNLRLVPDFNAVLLELNLLVKLDISDDKESPVDVLNRATHNVGPILRRPDLYPDLQHLDISGKEGIELEDLKKFFAFKASLGEDHCLKFLGLMQTDVCTNDVFLTDSNNNNVNGKEFAELTVTGFATEQQILNSLKSYADRPAFIQKSLCYLYNYTINDMNEPRIDMIEIILSVLKKHSKVIGIQMAATACLYNLTKGKIADKIHPSWLGRVVNATLVAMETFPNHQQLQKNTLLTLCSDRILQEVTFNRFKCTKLVMESLVNFKDVSMNRMAVAICSILAAKISTDETSSLGAKPIYMETLLQVVKSKVYASQQVPVVPPAELEPDIMLKFTLSALWNLTDESPSTCSMFLEKGGIPLYLQVLKYYKGLPSVEMKILGLLNNIAEVPALRSQLLEPEFIHCLRELLASPSIDVSYFAAGIFAHLMSDQEVWHSHIHLPRSDISKQLVSVVLGWKSPENEMVAYRSFKPFLPLMRCDDAPEVQLWAIWAIHHVCSKNSSRYCEMLMQPETLFLFMQMMKSAKEKDRMVIFEFCQMTAGVLSQTYPHLAHRFFQ